MPPPLRSRAQDELCRRAVPAVLLVACVGGFLGLAGLSAPPSPAPTVQVFAAAATAPLVLPAPVRRLPVVRPPLLRSPAARAATPKHKAAQRVSRSRAAAARAASARPRYVRPGVGAFTSGFMERWGTHHDGIDLAGPYGSPVRAVTAGRVIFAAQEQGYGNLVLIRHDDATVTAYAHLASFVVRAGRVDAGEIIAREGNSGHSTGPHLHFEVRINGVPIDPVPWLAKHGIYV